MPSAADLRARRLERIGSAVREVLAGGGFEAGRAVVEQLAQEFDIMDIAAAGIIALSQAQKSAAEESDIPDAASRHEPREGRGAREGTPFTKGAPRASRGRDQGSTTAPMARLWVGGGRKLKVRPGDIVGALTGETGITGTEIGAIRITDRYSLVDVPEPKADMIVAALRATTIKGKRLLVRRDRDV